MGCDIHMVGEVRGQEGSWTAIASRTDLDIESYGSSGLQEFYDGRWYELFGALSDGVRGYSGEPARGVPVDASDDVREFVGDEGDSDYHSHSWLSLMDLYRLCAADALDRGRVGSVIREIAERLEKCKPPECAPEDIRVVFSFDN